MWALGIETSCEETGIAGYDAAKGLLAHTIYTQTDIHASHNLRLGLTFL